MMRLVLLSLALPRLKSVRPILAMVKSMTRNLWFRETYTDVMLAIRFTILPVWLLLLVDVYDSMDAGLLVMMIISLWWIIHIDKIQVDCKAWEFLGTGCFIKNIPNKRFTLAYNIERPTRPQLVSDKEHLADCIDQVQRSSPRTLVIHRGIIMVRPAEQWHCGGRKPPLCGSICNAVRSEDFLLHMLVKKQSAIRRVKWWVWEQSCCSWHHLWRWSKHQHRAVTNSDVGDSAKSRLRKTVKPLWMKRC